MKFSSRKFKRLRKTGLINSLRLLRRRKNKHVAITKSVIGYVDGLTAGTFDSALLGLWKETEALPMSSMQIDLTEAAFLRFLIDITGAKRILEAGTFRGWSTAVMASALAKNDPGKASGPGDEVSTGAGESSVITMQIRPEEASQATELWRRHLGAGVLAKIDQRIGNAVTLMKEMINSLQVSEAQFDLIFIDADKAGYGTYLAYAQKLVREGGLIILDNMLNAGLVATKADDKVTSVLRGVNKVAFSAETTAAGFEPVIIPAWDGVVVLRKR
jgi:O-methyltransferase